VCVNLIRGTTMNVAQPSGRSGSSNVAINVLKRTVKTSKQSPSVSASAQQARETWLQALNTASHRLVEQKRSRFWRTQADNATNPSRLWQTIDAVLGRGKENNPTFLTPEDFSAFFTSKVEDVRRRTQCAPPHQYREVDENVVNFSAFNPVAVAEIMKLIQEAPKMQLVLVGSNSNVATLGMQRCSVAIFSSFMQYVTADWCGTYTV